MSSINVLSSQSEETDEPGVPTGSFRNPNNVADKEITTIQKDIHLKGKEAKRREDEWNELAVSGNRSHSVGSAIAPGIPKYITVHDSEIIYKNCGPLDEGNIRILFVCPAKRESDPLVCSLQIESLNKTPKPDYAALSYCWGFDHSSAELFVLPSGVEVDTLHLDAREVLDLLKSKGSILRIGENLKSALLRLRSSEKRIALWVDAVCINQKNNEEKTQQLRQMAQVYLRANSVCVWLGEADEDGESDRAMDFIPEIIDFSNHESLFTDRVQAGKWLSLAELMKNPWFSRRWVIQEISLAAAASIYCGSKTVRWEDFADAVSILIAAQEQIKKLFIDWPEGPQALGEVQTFGANVLLRAIESLFLKDTKGGITRPTKRLEHLVTSLSTFDSSNNRDTVYSLAAIASDTYNPSSYGSISRKNEDTGAYKLVIDYEKLNEIDFYKHFVDYCIISSESLDIICRPWAIPPKNVKPFLPSWVCLSPDFKFGKPEDFYSGRKNGERIMGPVDSPRYNASGGRKYEISPKEIQVRNSLMQGNVPRKDQMMLINVPESILPSTIWAEGFKLARITRVSSTITSGLVPKSSLRDIGWTGIKNGQNAVPDHVWRVLIADRDYKGQRPSFLYQRVCLQFLELAEAEDNGDLNIDRLSQGLAYMPREYLARARDATFNRRFFRATTVLSQAQNDNVLASQDGISSDNDLVGLCPEGAVQGDLICILYGCSVPVLLRECESERNTFKVIGETYTHGKMDGEGMENYMGREQSFGLV